MPTQSRQTLWPARLMILPVLAWNLQCGIVFLVHPATYVGGFELDGVPGRSLVQALGLLFIMWSVPYAVALFHPLRQRVAVLEALAMQTIGLLGESWLLAKLPAEHIQLRITTWRFIWFDGAGVVLLLLALLWIERARRGSPVDNIPPLH